MNTQNFEQAKAAYDAKDYVRALNGFSTCLNDVRYPLAPGEMGLIYHQIGNCLVKLNNCNDAIQAYTQATADGAYDAIGSVRYNLGMAYAALKDYEDAVGQFSLAVSDAKYETPYKAYVAMGNALMKLGKSAEAGVAFREAALDERNADPTKALLNLGVCFMALNRPNDAVVAYESALQFDLKPDTRNKIYSNLGQAYATSGQMQKAVHAFEEALADGTYFLSDSASVDYQRAVGAVAQGFGDVQAGDLSDDAGFDIVDGDGYYDDGFDGEYVEYDEYGNPIQGGAYYGDEGYYDEEGNWQGPADDDRFFTASDEEIEAYGKGLDGGKKRHGAGFKVLIIVLILVIVVLAGGIAGYVMGFGFPTQQSVAEELFSNPDTAISEVFSSDLGSAKANALASMIPADATITVNGVNRGMKESTVYVTAQTKNGGEIPYKISMVRDKIGWKISNVEYCFASQN